MVDKAKDAISLLKDKEWDWLFLDHDLGDEASVESGPGTGYEVAEWLEQNPEYKPEKIVVHSMNPAGRDKMLAALKDAYYIMVAWLKSSDQIEERLKRQP
jgi:CheY-like chemotaxis protein